MQLPLHTKILLIFIACRTNDLQPWRSCLIPNYRL